MKTTRTEKLADHLTELDGDLLSTAYEIDDAEKLKQYTRPKYQIKPHLVRKLTAIAACLTLIIATAFTLPTVLPEQQTQPSGTTSTTATSDENIILPPVRVGTQGTLKLMYSDEFDTVQELSSGADAIVSIRIKNWIAEYGLYTYYEAEVIEVYAGSMPETFVFQQFGSSQMTVKGDPLYTYGNEYLIFASKDACVVMKDENGNREPFQYPDANTYTALGCSPATLELVTTEDGKSYFIDRTFLIPHSQLAITNYYDQLAIPVRTTLVKRDPEGLKKRDIYQHIYSVDDLVAQIK